MSFSSCLLVCRNRFFHIDFVSNSLTKFIYSESLYVLNFLPTQSCHLASDDSFVYWLSDSNVLWSFFALLHWLGPLMWLDRRGDGGHPCLIPSLKEKTCNTSPLNKKFAVGFFLLDKKHWGSFLLFLVSSGYWVLSNVFPLSVEMVIVFCFSFLLLCG